MDKNTKSIVSVKNELNKSGAKKLRLDEAHQKFPNLNTICGSSERFVFAGLCKQKGAKLCDEKNIKIFNRFENRGELNFKKKVE